MLHIIWQEKSWSVGINWCHDSYSTDDNQNLRWLKSFSHQQREQQQPLYSICAELFLKRVFTSVSVYILLWACSFTDSQLSSCQECACSHSMRDDLSETLQRSERSFLFFLERHGDKDTEMLLKQNIVYKKNYCISSHSPACVEPKYILLSRTAGWEYNKIPVLNLRPAAQLLCVRLLCTQHGFPPTKDKHFI